MAQILVVEDNEKNRMLSSNVKNQYSGNLFNREVFNSYVYYVFER